MNGKNLRLLILPSPAAIFASNTLSSIGKSTHCPEASTWDNSFPLIFH
jgi:hypothetical protein